MTDVRGSTYELGPVGVVRGPRVDVVDDDRAGVDAAVELDAASFGPDAVAGLDGFGHLEIVFLFDRVPSGHVHTGARHPRGNTDWPRVGIFAQRVKIRPNRLGVSLCALLRVEGTRLHARGLDAVDGAPVLDVEPYMAEFGPRGEVRQPDRSRELVRDYY